MIRFHYFVLLSFCFWNFSHKSKSLCVCSKYFAVLNLCHIFCWVPMKFHTWISFVFDKLEHVANSIYNDKKKKKISFRSMKTISTLTLPSYIFALQYFYLIQKLQKHIPNFMCNVISMFTLFVSSYHLIDLNVATIFCCLVTIYNSL